MTHVIGKAQHDLWRTVPSRRNILRHESLIRSSASSVTTTTGTVSASQTEVANLELAIGIHQEVAWLEITMENVCGMDVFETAQGLIDEGLEVGVGKRLLRADLERKADMSCAEMIK